MGFARSGCADANDDRLSASRKTPARKIKNRPSLEGRFASFEGWLCLHQNMKVFVSIHSCAGAMRAPAQV